MGSPAGNGPAAALLCPVRDRPRRHDRGGRAAVDRRRPRVRARPGSSGSSPPTRWPSADCSSRPDAPPTCSAAGACSSPAWRCSPPPRRAAGWPRRRRCWSAMRAVQGTGAALLAPAALALVSDAHPGGPERRRALGLWTAAAAGGGRDRLGARRRAHADRRLAGDLLHERPRRDRGRPARAACPARRPRPCRRAEARRARPAGRAAGDRRSRRARVRPDRGAGGAASVCRARRRCRRCWRPSSQSSGASRRRCCRRGLSATATSPARCSSRSR